MITKKTPQMTGPLAELYGRDPLQFVLKYTRKNANRVSDLLHRVVQRTGVTYWQVPAPGGGSYDADMVPRGDDDNIELAIKLILWMKKNNAVVMDEIRRRSFGLAYGLDGDAAQESTGGSADDEIDWNALLQIGGKAVDTGSDILGGLFGLSDAREKPAKGETVTVTKSAPPPWLLIGLAGVVVFLVVKKG